MTLTILITQTCFLLAVVNSFHSLTNVSFLLLTIYPEVPSINYTRKIRNFWPLPLSRRNAWKIFRKCMKPTLLSDHSPLRACVIFGWPLRMSSFDNHGAIELDSIKNGLELLVFSRTFWEKKTAPLTVTFSVRASVRTVYSVNNKDYFEENVFQFFLHFPSFPKIVPKIDTQKLGKKVRSEKVGKIENGSGKTIRIEIVLHFLEGALIWGWLSEVAC